MTVVVTDSTFSLGFADWIGAFLGVAGILTGYIFFRRGKAITLIDYELESTQTFKTDISYPGLEIITNFPDEASRRRVELAKPIVYKYFVVNIGNQPIERRDFKDAITVRPKAGDRESDILSVTVAEASRDGIHVLGPIGRDSDASTYSIIPELLNPGDWLEVWVLGDSLSGAPVLSAWLRGQKREMQRRSSLRPREIPRQFTIVKATSALGALTAMGFVLWIIATNGSDATLSVSMLAAGACAAAFTYSYTQGEKYDRRLGKRGPLEGQRESL